MEGSPVSTYEACRQIMSGIIDMLPRNCKSMKWLKLRLDATMESGEESGAEKLLIVQDYSTPGASFAHCCTKLAQ